MGITQSKTFAKIRQTYTINGTQNDYRFGTVYHVTNKKTKENFFCKARPANPRLEIKSRDKVEERIKLSHPALLKFTQAVYEHHKLASHNDHVFILYPVPVRDMEQELNCRQHSPDNQKFTEHEIRGLIAQVTVACLYLQNEGIAHGDIQPRQIFYDPVKKNYKIYDNLFIRYGESMHSKKLLLVKTYPSPEELVMNYEGDPYKIDVFGLGCTVISLALCRPIMEVIVAFQKEKLKGEAVLRDLLNQVTEAGYTEELGNLINWMTQFEQAARPDWEELSKYVCDRRPFDERQKIVIQQTESGLLTNSEVLRLTEPQTSYCIKKSNTPPTSVPKNDVFDPECFVESSDIEDDTMQNQTYTQAGNLTAGNLTAFIYSPDQLETDRQFSEYLGLDNTCTYEKQACEQSHEKSFQRQKNLLETTAIENLITSAEDELGEPVKTIAFALKIPTVDQYFSSQPAQSTNDEIASGEPVKTITLALKLPTVDQYFPGQAGHTEDVFAHEEPVKTIAYTLKLPTADQYFPSLTQSVKIVEYQDQITLPMEEATPTNNAYIKQGYNANGNNKTPLSNPPPYFSSTPSARLDTTKPILYFPQKSGSFPNL